MLSFTASLIDFPFATSLAIANANELLIMASLFASASASAFRCSLSKELALLTELLGLT